METPWAADLAQLGIASLFLDRRGHGRSTGNWWPNPPGPAPSLTELYPDIQASLDYLRRRPALIDPDRIALLGHSDGGTAAMVSASNDWEVAATVSLSASVAPWEYLNHVAPKNLLLLYGGEDTFILNDTDTLLIKRATRGYLDDVGQVGSLSDGTARRLIRIHGRGHVDILYSASARRHALTWLAKSFHLDPRQVVLTSTRIGHVVAGLLCLWLLLLFWRKPSAAPLLGTRRWFATTTNLIVIAGLWGSGLAYAHILIPFLYMMPVQQGNVLVGTLSIELALLACVLAFLASTGRLRAVPYCHQSALLDFRHGMFAVVPVVLSIQILVKPVYETALDVQRMLLWIVFLIAALPLFAVTSYIGAWFGSMRGGGGRFFPLEFFLGTVTAILAPHFFVRMAVFPIQLLAAALVFTGAYRVGGRSPASATVFGAILYARTAAAICAFY